jgi:flagellar hook-basal body complex protein FliE
MTTAVTAMNGIASAMDSLAMAASAPVPQLPPPATVTVGQPSFSTMFRAAIDRLDDGVAAANAAVTGFASGNSDIPLSDVMMSLEEANLGLQTAATVSDKVLSAYTTIMNMPV